MQVNAAKVLLETEHQRKALPFLEGLALGFGGLLSLLYVIALRPGKGE